MTKGEMKALTRVDALRDTLVKQVCELVAIPTVNPFSGDPTPAGEAAGQAWIERQFLELGAEVRRVPVPADIYARCGVPGPPGRNWVNRDNVVAAWHFGEGGPTILLNSHMDTVGTAGMSISPFDPVVKDGMIFGRGSSDSKGNLVMGLTAMRALIDSGLLKRGRVVFESVVDEECSGSGAGTLACCEAGVTGDLAIVMDGSRGLVVTGCNGIATVWLGVKGRAGHSSQGLAVSAIDKGMVVKGAVDAFMAENAKRYPGCGGTLGVFRAGTHPSTVPGEAVLAVNLKYAIEDARMAERETGVWGSGLIRKRFETALQDLGGRDPWFVQEPVVVTWTTDMVPFETDVRHPLVLTAVQAATEATGLTPEAGIMAAWFDGARLSKRLGIPVIGLGHGGSAQAHTASERVKIDDLTAGARTLALTLLRLMR